MTMTAAEIRLKQNPILTGLLLGLGQGTMIAWSENMIPPSWDDAVCWEVNAAGVPSDQPVGWMHPPAQGGGDE